MTTTEATWTTESVRVAGQPLPFLKGGSGDPLLVLHHDIGSPAGLPFYDVLARNFTVLPAFAPGLRRLRAPEVAAQRARRRGHLPVRCSPSAGSPEVSLRRARLRWLDRRGDGDAWRRAAFRRLVLVGAMGIKPDRGRDPRPGARVSYIEYVRAGLRGPERVRAHLRRRAADEPARAVGPQPRDDVPHRVEAVHVQPVAAAPAGRRARRPPWSCGGATTASCRSSAASATPRRCPRRRLAVVEGAGHFVEMEQPDALAQARRPSSSPRPDQETSHAPHVLHRAADVGLPRGRGPGVRGHRADVLQPALRSGRGQPPLQRVPRALPARRGGRLRRHHAERAPQRAVLHAGQVQRLRLDPGRHHQAGEDRAARQPAPARRQPGAAGRGAGDDRHGLARAAGLRLRARRRPGAARHRRQPRLQPRALRGGARPDRARVDAARARSAGRARTTSIAW